MMTIQKIILKIVVLILLFSWPAQAMAPAVYNKNSMSFFLEGIKDFRLKSSIMSTIKYKDMVTKALLAEGVDATVDEISEILGQILHESGGNPNAIGSSGEIGLMQLMPSTARLMGVNPRNPYQNILGGVRYRQHLRFDYKFNGDMVLAAYNAGPVKASKCGKCRKYISAVTSWARIFKSVLINS